MSLLKTVDEVNKYVAVGKQFSIKLIKPDISDIGENLIKWYLGTTLYETLLSEYESDSLTADNQELLPYPQKVITNLAIARNLDFSQVQITDYGVNRTESDQSRTAFHYQKIEAQRYLERRGYNALEDLLLHLEEKKDTFTSWQNSEGYSILTRHWITTADQFSQYFNIRGSRLTYMALSPIMSRIENFQIKDTLGSDFYSEVKGQLFANDLGGFSELVNDFIRPAIAYLTVSEATNDLPLELQGNGIVINNLSPGQGAKEEKTSPLDYLEKLRNSAQDTGKKYLNRLWKHLQQNASDSKYSTFYNSELYEKENSEWNKQSGKVYGAF